VKAATLLNNSVRMLSDAGIATARLDAVVLLEDITGKDRAWLLAHPEHEISSTKHARLKKLLNRRSHHEPLAYLRNKTEFYGREFFINSDVLEPRPESETMLDLLKKLPILGKKGSGVRLADVGTGSGALGITAKLELPELTVDLIDIDTKALEVAKTNVDKFTLNISTINSDLLDKTTPGYEILLCNLPYVPDGFKINTAAMREPKTAIYGGPDGLDVYRRLFAQISNLKNRPLYILTEAMPRQHSVISLIAKNGGYSQLDGEDFVQVFKARAAAVQAKNRH
jgi:release factor glutamine methyltransferase